LFLKCIAWLIGVLLFLIPSSWIVHRTRVTAWRSCRQCSRKWLRDLKLHRGTVHPQFLKNLEIQKGQGVMQIQWWTGEVRLSVFRAGECMVVAKRSTLFSRESSTVSSQIPNIFLSCGDKNMCSWNALAVACLNCWTGAWGYWRSGWWNGLVSLLILFFRWQEMYIFVPPGISNISMELLSVPSTCLSSVMVAFRFWTLKCLCVLTFGRRLVRLGFGSDCVRCLKCRLVWSYGFYCNWAHCHWAITDVGRKLHGLISHLPPLSLFSHHFFS